MKILIFGNSVGLNVRPNKDSKWTYARLLETEYPFSEGHIIVNKCKWNWMITDETLENFANVVLQIRPDFVIFNYGINESAPRVLPKSVWRILNSQDGRKSEIKLFINKIIKYFSPTIIKKLNLKGWIKEEIFLYELQNRIELIQNETHAKILVLGITKTNERVEKQLPQINDYIKSFNIGMAKLIENKEGCYFIDVFDLEHETGDGIHYTDQGHRILFERMMRCIEEETLCVESRELYPKS